MILAAEPGLEPGLRDPKSLVLPLHHSAAFLQAVRRSDPDPRHDNQGGVVIFPPCSVNVRWCRRPGSNRHESRLSTVFETVASTSSATSALERKTRFELATPSLARRCSTAELLPPPETRFAAWRLVQSRNAPLIISDRLHLDKRLGGVPIDPCTPPSAFVRTPVVPPWRPPSCGRTGRRATPSAGRPSAAGPVPSELPLSPGEPISARSR